MQNMEVLDFKSLCNKFDLMINIKNFDKAQEIIDQIENNYPKEKNTCAYYKVIVTYYDKRNESIKMYDKLFLTNNMFTCEGYFFSIKVSAFYKKEIKINIADNYSPLNPSILRDNNGYIMNVRCSNYKIYPGGKYFSLDSDKIIRTRNLIRHLDNNFNIVEEYELVQPKQYCRNDDFGIKGFEDVRLVKNNDQLYFMSATYDTHKMNVQRVVLGKIENKEITNVFNLNIPGQKKTNTEKNFKFSS